MSAPPLTKGEPITSKRQLVDYIAAGSKERKDWRIGTEHEKFAFTWDDLRRLPYEGPRGIRALLEGLARTFGWTPISETAGPIALTKDRCNITLEPGGQFELSGAPLETIHQTCGEVHRHLSEVKHVAEPLGIGMLGMGFDPKWRREDVPWTPKGRYKIMGEYMPKQGKLGLDMMLRTCTVQVNLDFENEADMVEKFRVSLALQPIATALFANSPFTEGEPNGFLSYRSHVWTDTDPDRTGMLPFVFEPGMGFERYVDHVLDVPMYFVYRDGQYLDVSGQSFRDFMAGKLPGLPGEVPTTSDWQDHMTTLFPEVRLKRFLEMRGADAGPPDMLAAMPAFWVGLLYDATALDAAWDLVKNWSAAERQALRDAVPREGLAATIGGRKLGEIAGEVLELSRAGLARRARLNAAGTDESAYLAPLHGIVARGQTLAQHLAARYRGEWGGTVEPVFTELAL